MDPWKAFLATLSSREAMQCADEIAEKAGTRDGHHEIFRAAAELLAAARSGNNRAPEWMGYPQEGAY